MTAFEISANLDERWAQFETMFEKKFQKKPDIETAFFIIGLQHHFNGHALNRQEKERLIA